MKFEHIPVLYNETIEGLNVKPEGTYLDCTLGGGGHSSAILERLKGGRLVGIDQDQEAIDYTRNKLADYGDSFFAVKGNFEQAPEILESLGIDGLDGILMDIGLSSQQIDVVQRGFSYSQDAPLDMRMNRDLKFSAYDVVNQYSQEELVHIFRNYGEERYSGRIARNIVEKREIQPIETTGQLADLIEASVPFSKAGHPAKRVFQAIRIEVNRELEVLENAISPLVDFLNPGGRFCIITFHSLEDRIVKNAFRDLEGRCSCPPGFPVCVCEEVQKLKVINRRPITASKEELEANPRAASAKLRIAERV